MQARSFDSPGIRRRTFLTAAAAAAVWGSVPGFARKALAAEPPTAGKPVQIGDFSVIPLFDGPQSFPLSLFKGADEAAMLQAAGVQPIPGAFNVFLIERGKDRILVDAGNGTRPGRAGQLPLCLRDAKTGPEEITAILITHLHGDHIGGLVKDGRTAFPKAKVHVTRIEYDYWTSEESMRQAPEGRRGAFALARDVMRVLEQDKLLVFFTPGDEIGPGIASVPLFGHTPGHTGFMLASQGAKLLCAGDLLHGAALQMPRPDITVDFDVDQPQARETRLRLFKQLAETGIPMAGAHLPFPGIWIVQAEGAGYKLKAC